MDSFVFLLFFFVRDTEQSEDSNGEHERDKACREAWDIKKKEKKKGLP